MDRRLLWNERLVCEMIMIMIMMIVLTGDGDCDDDDLLNKTIRIWTDVYHGMKDWCVR